MKLSIRGDKITVTKAIKEYVAEKLSRLDKYFDSPKDIECRVLIKVKNQDQNIEVTVPTSKFTLRAEERHQDLYAAIDLVVDKLEGQIRKNKTRLKKKIVKNDREDVYLDFDIDEEDELDIIKRKNIDTKPMDEEEAILQMQLLNHDFFVFKNTTEECVSVIYKRKDNISFKP